MALETFQQRYSAADVNPSGAFGFDLIGGTDWGVSKIAFGAIGSITHVDAANPFPVTIISAALPTGAATSAAQATGNALLASIDGKLPALGQALAAASVPIVLTAAQLVTLTPPAAITGFSTSAKQDTGNGSLASIDLKIVAADTGAVVIASSALPSGAATSSAQGTGNASLASIDGKVPALGQALAAASVPVVLTAAQLNTLTPLATVAVTGVATSVNQATVIASLASIDGHVDGVEGSLTSIDAKMTACNTGAVVVSSSALPTGGSTAARQDTGNASLASVDGKLPALGQALAAASVPIVLTAAQLVTLTPPAAITGFATSAKQDTANTSLGLLDDAVSGAGFNITQLNGVNVTMGNGGSGTGVQRVTLANDSTGIVALTTSTASIGKLAANAGVTIGAVEIAAAQTLATVSAVTAITNALPAGTNLLGKVGIDQTTPGTTNAVQDIPGTSGGLSTYSFLSTAAVQSATVKASAGQIYSIEFFNLNATPVYVRFYNKATTDDGSGTPIWRGIVPGNTAGAGFVKSWEKGIACATGISIRVTAAIADADTTALGANTVIGNVEYK